MGSPNLRKPSLQATVGFDCVTMSTLWRFKSWNLRGRSDWLNGLFGGSLPAAEKAKVEEKRHLAVVAQRPQTTVIRGSNIDKDNISTPTPESSVNDSLRSLDKEETLTNENEGSRLSGYDASWNSSDEGNENDPRSFVRPKYKQPARSEVQAARLQHIRRLHRKHGEARAARMRYIRRRASRDRQNRPKKKYAPRRCNNNKPTGLQPRRGRVPKTRAEEAALKLQASKELKKYLRTCRIEEETRKPSAVVYLRRISAEKTSDEGMDSSASIGSVKTKLKRIELVDQSGKSTGMSPEGAF